MPERERDACMTGSGDIGGRLPDEKLGSTILTELNALLLEPPLSNSERLKRFLRHIVEETVAGRSDRLSGYTIALDVFDKDEDFDPRASETPQKKEEEVGDDEPKKDTVVEIEAKTDASVAEAAPAAEDPTKDEKAADEKDDIEEPKKTEGAEPLLDITFE